MRYSGFGQIVFGASFAALGALLIAWPDMGQIWQTIPRAFPFHDALTTVSGIILVVGGLGLLVPPTARPAALLLAALLLWRLVRIKMYIMAKQPLVEVAWEDTAESVVQLAGAWIVFTRLSPKNSMFATTVWVRVGQILFALSMLPFGLSHFFYLNMTAPLIPSWLPFHVPLAYFTGAAHIAAGLGILFGGFLFASLPWFAATLEAVMVSLFTLLVWVPRVIGAPANHENWSEICISTAIAGAAWLVAQSLREKPLTFERRPSA